MSPDAVQIARLGELEFMDKLRFLHEVLLSSPRWKTKPTGTKWGDGDRVDIQSRHVATELKVHPIKMGILRDDVFSATPPLEAVRLLMSLMMAENTQAKMSMLMSIDISRAHFHSPYPRDECACSCCWRGRDQVGLDCCSRACTEQEARRIPSQQQSWTRRRT